MEIIITTFALILLPFALYRMVLVVAGTMYKDQTGNISTLPSIKVLLPAYAPSPIFIDVLSQLKKAIATYDIDVFVLFQNADQSIVEASATFGFRSEHRNFDHRRGNGYHHALKYLCGYELDSDSHAYTMILDKDNLIAPDFFERLAKLDLTNFDVLQGIRKPINIDSDFQLFDAISERYNDLMLRSGKCVLGGVPELSGSAALIRTDLFKQIIDQLDPKAPGFDKNFMVHLLTNPDAPVASYDRQLIVHEEKTANEANYRSQRLRWFGEQYYNAFHSTGTLLGKFLSKGRWTCLDYWMTLVRPPRSLQLVVSCLLFTADLLTGGPGMASLPFLFNAFSFIVVAFPFLTRQRLQLLISGTWKVIKGNLLTSISCLRAKYLGRFIHTR